MDVETRGFLVGMIFGDAYVNVRNRLVDGRYYYESSEMRVLHSIAQRDYCEHKAARTRQALKRKFSVTIVNNGPGGAYKAAAFSASHPYFKQLKRWCYPNGKKTFTKHTLEMLTPEGIAFWYLDDGNARRNTNKDGWVSSVATDISTMCSKEEAEIIVAYFLDKHGIAFNIRCNKRCVIGKQFFIQANTAESRKFIALVQPFIIPSMLYKIAHVADMNAHERQTPLAACQCGAPIYANRTGGLCVPCYSKRYHARTAKFRAMI